jgi:hypothetical protein
MNPVRPTHGLPRQGEDDASGLQPEDALDQSLRKITLASQPNKSASAAVTPP